MASMIIPDRHVLEANRVGEPRATRRPRPGPSGPPSVRSARDVGPAALRRRPPPGAPRRLAPDQLARVPEWGPRGPSADGFRGERWTRRRVAAMSRVACGISSPPRHVGRRLAGLRWSPQKPVRRARPRTDAALAPGRDAPWPAITTGRTPSSPRSWSETRPGVTRGPGWCAPLLPWGRRRFGRQGLPVTSCRRSAPCRPRASSPSMRRSTRGTRLLSSPFCRPSSLRCPAAGSSFGMAPLFIAVTSSRRSWPRVRPNGGPWRAGRRPLPNAIRARACGNRSTGASGATSAASIARIGGTNGVTRSHEVGEHHAGVKAFSKEQDFRS